jgi:hypothetical protein
MQFQLLYTTMWPWKQKIIIGHTYYASREGGKHLPFTAIHSRMYLEYNVHLSCYLCLALATGQGNPPAVRVWTGKMVRFSSRTIQKPDLELLGRPNPYLYLSTRRICRVWLDPSVPVSGSPFRVFLFMVAVTYVTVMCKISTLVHHSLYLFHWRPLYSKQGETCSLLRAEVECDQLFILQHL